MICYEITIISMTKNVNGENILVQRVFTFRDLIGSFFSLQFCISDPIIRCVLKDVHFHLARAVNICILYLKKHYLSNRDWFHFLMKISSAHFRLVRRVWLK